MEFTLLILLSMFVTVGYFVLIMKSEEGVDEDHEKQYVNNDDTED